MTRFSRTMLIAVGGSVAAVGTWRMTSWDRGAGFINAGDAAYIATANWERQSVWGNHTSDVDFSVLVATNGTLAAMLAVPITQEVVRAHVRWLRDPSLANAIWSVGRVQAAEAQLNRPFLTLGEGWLIPGWWPIGEAVEMDAAWDDGYIPGAITNVFGIESEWKAPRWVSSRVADAAANAYPRMQTFSQTTSAYEFGRTDKRLNGPSWGAMTSVVDIARADWWLDGQGQRAIARHISTFAEAEIRNAERWAFELSRNPRDYAGPDSIATSAWVVARGAVGGAGFGSTPYSDYYDRVRELYSQAIGVGNPSVPEELGGPEEWVIALPLEAPEETDAWWPLWSCVPPQIEVASLYLESLDDGVIIGVRFNPLYVVTDFAFETYQPRTNTFDAADVKVYDPRKTEE
jgi:hypothetical protein